MTVKALQCKATGGNKKRKAVSGKRRRKVRKRMSYQGDYTTGEMYSSIIRKVEALELRFNQELDIEPDFVGVDSYNPESNEFLVYLSPEQVRELRPLSCSLKEMQAEIEAGLELESEFNEKWEGKEAHIAKLEERGLGYISHLEKEIKDLIIYSKKDRIRFVIPNSYTFTRSARPVARARSVRRASRPTFSKAGSGGGGSGGDGESDQGDPPKHNPSITPYSLPIQPNRFSYPWLVLGSCCVERGRAA